jgi:hypothetical protein
MTGSDPACSAQISEAIGGTPDAPKRCRIVADSELPSPAFCNALTL